MKKLLFDDPSGGIINLRYQIKIIESFNFLDINEDEKKDIFILIQLISRKLSFVWKHQNNYINLEKDLIKKAKEKPIVFGQKDNQIEYSQDLFNEFDEFLVQVKSCLDHLAKVPAVIFGKKRWSLRTFSGKGDDVIKSLKNNTPTQYKKFIPGITKVIEEHQTWFKDIISARDRINHFIDGGINFENFAVFFKKNSTSDQLVIPMWSNEQSIKELLEIVWMNLFRFSEDFSLLFLGMRMKIEYGLLKIPLPKDTDPTISPWKIDLNCNLKKIFENVKWENK